MESGETYPLDLSPNPFPTGKGDHDREGGPWQGRGTMTGKGKGGRGPWGAGLLGAAGDKDPYDCGEGAAAGQDEDDRHYATLDL